ncbi:MAG: hypothetical protein ACYC4Q_03130 [Victivallaceae bacterium]
MALKYKILSGKAFFLPAVIMLAGIAGCGKKDIPDPPLSQNRLVSDVFKDLADNKHEQAIDKIIKLKAIDPENVFLAELEENEVNNIYMNTVQQQLDAGNVNAALKTIEQARKKHGLYRSLMQVDAELKNLRSLQEAVTRMQQAESSDRVYAEIELCRKIISEYPSAKALEPMLRRNQIEADRMARKENMRSRFSLLCDISTSRQNSLTCAKTMTAELELENNLTENRNSRVPATLFTAQ